MQFTNLDELATSSLKKIEGMTPQSILFPDVENLQSVLGTLTDNVGVIQKLEEGLEKVIAVSLGYMATFPDS